MGGPRRPRPAVVAHRGSSADVAEHTAGAYRRALVEGADGVECDVRLTRDGVLVCVHDRRVDRTSSGRGPVSSLELADLADLDFAGWKGVPGEAEAVESDAGRVLTLDRLLDILEEGGREVDVAIETKHPTRYAGIVERVLVETLSRRGLLDPATLSPLHIRVMSFSSNGLRRVRRLAPTLPTVLLMSHISVLRRDGSLPVWADIAGPSIASVRADPSYVGRVQATGKAVHVWTADHDDDIDMLVRLGVDAIITNRPGPVIARLGARV